MPNQNWSELVKSVIFSAGLTGKLLSLLCVLGYVLSYSSLCVRVFAVIPGRLMPPNFWIWTLLTHSFIEIHFWHTIIDILVILFYTKMIETLWGTKESIKFYFIVTIPNAILATSIYFILYGVTFNEEYLFERPIYGSAAFIGGYSVVIKQIVPDTTLATTPFFKFKQDQIPLLLVFLTTFAWLGNGVPNHFLIMLTLGIFIGWTYLRFFQTHQDGTRGDPSASFSFASFFPSPIAPIVSVFANTVFELFVKIKLCKPFVKKYNHGLSTSITITIPGPEAADAERRKQKALKALNDRMKSKETPTDSWPELEENASQSNSSNPTETHSNSTSIPMVDRDESHQIHLESQQTPPTHS